MEIIKILEKLYPRLDKIVAERAANSGATCSKGCSACCSLYALTTIADGYNIACEIITWKDRETWLKKLAVRAKEMTTPGINRYTWTAKNIPCIFLQENRLCRIYEKRPAECRFFYVVSDPKLCDLDVIQKIAILNTREFEMMTWTLSLAAQRDNPQWFSGEVPFKTSIPGGL